MKKHELLSEFLSETSELHALMHGIWAGVKGIKWKTLPKEARKEIKKEFQYFELGQMIGWILKIGLPVLLLKLSM